MCLRVGMARYGTGVLVLGGGGGDGGGSGDYDDSCFLLALFLCRVFFWFADLLIYSVACLNCYVRSRKAHH